MPRRYRGLDSSIGTFTHSEWRPTGDISQRSSISELRRAIAKLERDIHRRKKGLLAEGVSYLAYCTVCGKKEWFDETLKSTWINKQGCFRDPLCSNESEIKHCRRCGKEIKKADHWERFIAKRQGEIRQIQEILTQAYETTHSGT